MAVFVFKSSKSRDPTALGDIVSYITDASKVPRGAIASTYFPPEYWQKMAQIHKRLHGKLHKRQYQHCILSFADTDAVFDYPTAMRIGKEVAATFKGMPTLYTVHDNTKHLHLHFVYSATDIQGKQVGLSPKMFSHFMECVGDIVEGYGCKRPLPQKVEEYNQDMEETEMENYFELEAPSIKPDDEDCEIVIPQMAYPQRRNYVSAYDEYAPQSAVYSGQNPFAALMPQGTSKAVANSYEASQRNQIYINNSPKVFCESQQQAEEVMKQMNEQCAQMTKAIVSGISNGLPVDVALNFGPEIHFGKS